MDGEELLRSEGGLTFAAKFRELAQIGPSAVCDFTDLIIREGLRREASDIHIEPASGRLLVRYRLDGVLHPPLEAATEHAQNVVARVKVLAELLTYQTDMPQEGRIDKEKVGAPSDLRVSTFPTVHGEKAVIRLFDREAETLQLADLGYADTLRTELERQLQMPAGVALLTGPAGSGKTTTINASLKHILKTTGNARNIVSVEDPVERVLDGITQTEVRPVAGLTFARCLRSLMRQDPEVIVIGEIRDEETAGIAIEAGLTGHLVISTIHSGTTSGTFARLINMNIEPFLLASTIIGVLGVRLLRQNCLHCSAPYQPEAFAIEQLRQHEGSDYVNQILEHDSFYRGTGCTACGNTGFGGRSSITELLTCDADVREAVMKKKPTSEIQEIAVNAGMTTLWDGGLQMVVDRKTTLEEILQKVAADQV